jgi:hypothetical protein
MRNRAGPRLEQALKPSAVSAAVPGRDMALLPAYRQRRSGPARGQATYQRHLAATSQDECMHPLRHGCTNRTLGDGATVVKCYQEPGALSRFNMSGRLSGPCRDAARCRKCWILRMAA